MDKTFYCEGEIYSLNSMLMANADDEDVCEWLKTAEVGDTWEGVTSLKRIS